MDLEYIIPSGNGGINGEGRTLKEICEKPVPEHLIKKLDDERLAPEVVNRMKADLARMGSSMAWGDCKVAREGWADCSYSSELSRHQS